jgi:3-deoxy-manno-octulosonate cytidylyltransferase (CMP-KDO synthetase)
VRTAACGDSSSGGAPPTPTACRPPLVLRFHVRPADCSDSILNRSQAHIPTVAIIPARYGSTRLPGKALMDLAGRPMIEHVYRRATLSRAADSVIVATDDDRIADVVGRFGGTACLTSRAHRTGTDRIAEVAASLECDLIVNVQGDEPLLEPAAIDAAVAPFAANPDLVMTTLRRRFEDPEQARNPNVVKVVVDREGFALYFSRAPIPFVRNPQTADSAAVGPFKHIGLYVYRRHFLLQLARLEPTPLELAESLEQLRVLEHGFAIKTLETEYDSIGVDTPEDLERVRRLLTADTRV